MQPGKGGGYPESPQRDTERELEEQERRKWGRVETREEGLGRHREEVGERESAAQREGGRVPGLARPQPSDVAVLISPALIASINNTAL